MYDRDIDRRKWRTREGFVYPGVSTARRSNTHPETPHPARAQDLNQVREGRGREERELTLLQSGHWN